MTGWETLSDAIASDSDQFGGQYLNRITQLLIGADIAASDATLAPVIGTKWTFKSGKLYLQDVAGTHTLQFLPDTQTGNTVVKIPAQSYTPDYVMLRTQAETIQNKIIDGGQNTLQNIPAASIVAAAGIPYSKLTLTNTIVNADIASAAAIAYSKLALTGSIVNADIGAAAAIAKTKLASLAIVDADVAAGAAIAKSKLATLSIVDADVNAAAAIAKTKLAALAIVDADVSAHTSTKITITDKTHLPATAAYLDAANTVSTGSFYFHATNAAAFDNAAAFFWNPAVTYSYSLRTSALLGNRLITLPLLTADDTFVFAGFANAFTGANTFNSFTMNDAQNIVLGSGTGTKIGTATTQKIGFYNKAPVVQAAAITTPTSDTVGTKAAIDAIRTVLINLGLTA